MFAGLRPLIRGRHPTDTAKLSRDHVVMVSAAGLVTITGGKWTTYRPMGRQAVDHAAQVGGLPPRPARPPRSASTAGSQEPATVGDPFVSYGSDADDLARLIAEEPGGAELIHPRSARACRRSPLGGPPRGREDGRGRPRRGAPARCSSTPAPAGTRRRAWPRSWPASSVATSLAGRAGPAVPRARRGLPPGLNPGSQPSGPGRPPPWAIPDRCKGDASS